MAYSYNRYISNGVTTTFTSPPYLEAEHISVEVQGVTLETSAYTLTGTVVNLHTTPLVSQEIIVRRSTSPSTRLVTFTSTYLDEDDLNRNADQLLYLMQEALDAQVGVAEYIDNVTSTEKLAAKVLTTGQTVVVFAETLGAEPYFRVNGESVDNTLLSEGTDYTLDLPNRTVTLAESYPAGTIISAYGLFTAVGGENYNTTQVAQNVIDIAQNAVDIAQNAVDIDALEAKAVVSVKDFGAVGDGVTDDTAACQAALDTGANEVIFPNRHYISQALTSTTDGQTISGVNWNVVGTGASAIVTDQDIEHIISTGNNCIIRYLGFDNTHPNMSKRHIHFSGGAFGVAQFVRTRAVENFSALGGGILFDDGAGGIGGVAGLVSNCNINHGTVEVKRSDVHINNSWIWANSRPSGIQAIGSVGNLKVDNCDVLPPQTLVTSPKAAIYLSGPLTIPVLDNVNFDGNLSLATGKGLLAEDGVIGLSVTGGNSFGHNDDAMVLDSIIAPIVNGVSFYNNNIGVAGGRSDISLEENFVQNLEKPNVTNCSFIQTAVVTGAAAPAVVLKAGVTRNGIKITNNSIQQVGTGGGYTDQEIDLQDGAFVDKRAGSLSSNTGTRNRYFSQQVAAFTASDSFKTVSLPNALAYLPRIDQVNVNFEGYVTAYRVQVISTNQIGIGFTAGGTGNIHLTVEL